MKRTRKTTSAGKRIISSLRELVEIVESGKDDRAQFTSRAVTMPAEPSTYKPAAVRATRSLLGASQHVFARLLGVSPPMVQGWERGAREPAPWARRLLDEVNRDPEHWRRLLRKDVA